MSDNYNPFNPTRDEVDAVDLSGMYDDFEGAEARDSEEVPDGKYQVRIHKAKLEKTKNGNPILKYDLLVISGSLAGRHLFKNSVLSFQSLPYFKGDLKIMGIELAKLSDLPGRTVDMLDLALEVTKKTRGEYVNVYFNKLLDIPSDGETPKGPIPF